MIRLCELLAAGPQDRSVLIPDSSAIISCRAGPGLARFLQISYCCRGVQAGAAPLTLPASCGSWGFWGNGEFESCLEGQFGGTHAQPFSGSFHRLSLVFLSCRPEGREHIRE